MSITPREKQIVERLLRYQKRTAIAADLSISLRTVRAHIERMMRKTGAQTVTHLVVLLSQHGNGKGVNGHGKRISLLHERQGTETKKTLLPDQPIKGASLSEKAAAAAKMSPRKAA